MRTLKDLVVFALALALVLLGATVLMNTDRFPPPRSLPLPNEPVGFSAIPLLAPGSVGRVLHAIANSKPQILWNGAIIWECPIKMKAFEPRTVILRVEKNRLDDFERDLDQMISRKKYGVDVATRTEAQLSGEEFSIILEEVAPRKIVADDVYQEWRWQVTPKSSGPHRLILIISPFAQIKDVLGNNMEGETPVGAPYRDQKDIDVSMNWPHVWREQMPQWPNIAVGVVIGTIVSFLIGLLRKLKRKPAKESPPPQNPEW